MVEAAAGQLAERLNKLAKLRDERDASSNSSKEKEAEFRRLEAQIVEEMLSGDNPITSLRVEGLGMFIVNSRTSASIRNLRALIEWAEENQLISEVEWMEDGRVKIPFEIAMATDSSGETKPTLINGIVRADAYKKPLNDYLHEAIQEGGETPAGLSVTNTLYISMRRSR